MSSELRVLNNFNDLAHKHALLSKQANFAIRHKIASDYLEEAYARGTPVDEVLTQLSYMGFDKEAGLASLGFKVLKGVAKGGWNLVKGTGRLMGFGGGASAQRAHKSFRLTRAQTVAKAPKTPRPPQPAKPPKPNKPPAQAGGAGAQKPPTGDAPPSKLQTAMQKGEQWGTTMLDPTMITGGVALGGIGGALAPSSGQTGIAARASGALEGLGSAVGIKKGPGVYKQQPRM